MELAVVHRVAASAGTARSLGWPEPTQRIVSVIVM